MNRETFEREPRTLREHNERLYKGDDLLTGKEFRRLKRKKK